MLGGKNQTKPPLYCYQNPAPVPRYSRFLPSVVEHGLPTLQKREGACNTNGQRQGFAFDYWTLYLHSGHTSSSARPPRGIRTSNTAGQLCRRRQGQWYLQVPIQAEEIPLGPHWQIVLVWPHERVGIVVIAYFPLIAFVTCVAFCCRARSEALLSDVLNQTAELSPAPQEQDVQEEAYNKLCSGTKHQQSSGGVGRRGCSPTVACCGSIKGSDMVMEELTHCCQAQLRAFTRMITWKKAHCVVWN